MPLNLKDIPGGTIITTMRADATAGATTDDSAQMAIFYAPKACKLLSVGIIPDVALAGHDTNKWTYTVYNKGTAGSGTTSVGAKTTTGTPDYSLVAHDYWEIVAASALKTMAAGEVLTIIRTHAATPSAAAPAMAVVVAWWPTAE